MDEVAALLTTDPDVPTLRDASCFGLCGIHVMVASAAVVAGVAVCSMACTSSGWSPPSQLWIDVVQLFDYARQFERHPYTVTSCWGTFSSAVAVTAGLAAIESWVGSALSLWMVLWCV